MTSIEQLVLRVKEISNSLPGGALLAFYNELNRAVPAIASMLEGTSSEEVSYAVQQLSSSISEVEDILTLIILTRRRASRWIEEIVSGKGAVSSRTYEFTIPGSDHSNISRNNVGSTSITIAETLDDDLLVLPDITFVTKSTPRIPFVVGPSGRQVLKNFVPGSTQTLMALAKAYREDMNNDVTLSKSNGISGKRNIGTAYLEINGNSDYLLAVSGKGYRPGSVPSRADTLLHPLPERENDSEVKILEEIAKRILDKSNIKGTVIIYSDLEPCFSCKWVIKEFKEKFPNISIVLSYGDLRSQRFLKRHIPLIRSEFP